MALQKRQSVELVAHDDEFQFRPVAVIVGKVDALDVRGFQG